MAEAVPQSKLRVLLARRAVHRLEGKMLEIEVLEELRLGIILRIYQLELIAVREP
jgi:hypothetical protein